jgi:DNA polymerase-4
MFRVIFHLDMDAFYASVEQRDHPELRGRPVIVGAPPSQRGVVCAARYEARKFGVRSAMPSASAGRLCPKGIFVRPRMEHYQEESREIMKILTRTGAVIEQMSIDEAYLDVSALNPAADADAALLGAVPAARQLKHSIQSERRLTATIGIAGNKLLAKIASDHQKPDGLTVITEKEKVQFMRPLPIRALYGVGQVTEAVGEEPKSISAEETFLRDTADRIVLRGCLREQAQDIAAQLKHRRLAAHTVQVKVRYGDFTTLTRQISLEEPLTEAREIYRLGCFLLGREKLVSRPLRLLGLGVSGLREPSGRQLALF